MVAFKNVMKISKAQHQDGFHSIVLGWLWVVAVGKHLRANFTHLASWSGKHLWTQKISHLHRSRIDL